MLVYQTLAHDQQIFMFVASLSVPNPEDMDLVYEVTCNKEPVRMLAELPMPVLSAYGTFYARVEDWKNGQELHESLRHDD